MMDGQVYKYPRSIGEILQDYMGRRAALVKALTTDLDDFYQKCDPDKEELCLVGHHNEKWEVTSPVEKVPPSIPDPVMGINYGRNELAKEDWLEFIALHCNSWLLAVATFLAARASFDKVDRGKLFDSILDIPTVYDVVMEGMAPVNSISTTTSGGIVTRNKSKSKSKSKSKRKSSPKPKKGASKLQKKPCRVIQPEGKETMQANEKEPSGAGDDNTICGACNWYGDPDEFWICCDECDLWYHGKCVNVNPEAADSIMHYECQWCYQNRTGTIRMA